MRIYEFFVHRSLFMNFEKVFLCQALKYPSRSVQCDRQGGFSSAHFCWEIFTLLSTQILTWQRLRTRCPVVDPGEPEISRNFFNDVAEEETSFLQTVHWMASKRISHRPTFLTRRSFQLLFFCYRYSPRTQVHRSSIVHLLSFNHRRTFWFKWLTQGQSVRLIKFKGFSAALLRANERYQSVLASWYLWYCFSKKMRHVTSTLNRYSDWNKCDRWSSLLWDLWQDQRISWKSVPLLESDRGSLSNRDLWVVTCVKRNCSWVWTHSILVLLWVVAPLNSTELESTLWLVCVRWVHGPQSLARNRVASIVRQNKSRWLTSVGCFWVNKQ